MGDDSQLVASRHHEQLLAEIGRLLGLRGPFREWRAPDRWWNEESGDDTPEPPDGCGVRVLGGVVHPDGQLAAWVEQHHFPPGADFRDGWVNVWLNLAGDGVRHLPRIDGWAHARQPRPHISVHLTHDRADRVTGVPYLRFFDTKSALIVVYQMIRRHYVCKLALGGSDLYGVQIDRAELGEDFAVVDGKHRWDGESTLCHLSQVFEDGDLLMYGLRLPRLTPEVPIPVPRLSVRQSAEREYVLAKLRRDVRAGVVSWVERRSLARGDWQDTRVVDLRLPTDSPLIFLDGDAAVIWDRLNAALAAPDVPPDGPDILIGAVAMPFWHASLSAPRGRQPASGVIRGPWWFPAAWYHYLRSPTADGGAARLDEATAWLNWLDRLATDTGSEDNAGWDPAWSPEEGVTRFAMIHLRRTAGELARACRSGKVPFLGDYDEGTRIGGLPVSAFPPGFARAWRCLPKTFRRGDFTATTAGDSI